MLVATPGQTSYSIVHNNSSNGGGNSKAAATSTTKKASTINSTNIASSGAAKSLNNNNNHTASTVTTKNSLNSNTHTTTFNHHQNAKSDHIVPNKISNYNKATTTTTTSSREPIAAPKTAAPHSLKNEKSTNSTNSKQQSFIQTLKDSVQKVLISTTGGSSNNNSIANKKYIFDNKLQNKCNSSTKSINNVTSSSSSTSHNANKVSTTTLSNNSTAATQSSSLASAGRSKYFSCSLSKLHTVAPTVIHRYPEERQNANSTDSLQKEMCHFKPIHIVPKTPWKSGSKSRGNNLRFPKANHATKNTEFVLKSNCDVNNRRKKQQQNRTKNDVNGADVDDNEQENKEFHGIYKPKPSLNCLSISVTTPSHQSAFVCLVSQMKNLVNLQSKRQLTPYKNAEAIIEIASEETINVVRKNKNSFKKPLKKVIEEDELPKGRGTRLSTSVGKSTLHVTNEAATQIATKNRAKRTNAKTSTISKASTVAITKAKSRRNLGRAKSKTTNMMTVTKAEEERLRNSISMPAIDCNKSTTIKSARKRKIAQDVEDLHNGKRLSTTSLSSAAKTTSVKSLSLGVRKSVRLSTKNIGSPTNTLYKYPTNTTTTTTQESTTTFSQNSRKNPKSVIRSSPIMTRSRLKHLAEQAMRRKRKILFNVLLPLADDFRDKSTLVEKWQNPIS